MKRAHPVLVAMSILLFVIAILRIISIFDLTTPWQVLTSAISILFAIVWGNICAQFFVPIPRWLFQVNHFFLIIILLHSAVQSSLTAIEEGDILSWIVPLVFLFLVAWNTAIFAGICRIKFKGIYNMKVIQRGE